MPQIHLLEVKEIANIRREKGVPQVWYNAKYAIVVMKRDNPDLYAIFLGIGNSIIQVFWTFPTYTMHPVTPSSQDHGQINIVFPSAIGCK